MKAQVSLSLVVMAGRLAPFGVDGTMLSLEAQAGNSRQHGQEGLKASALFIH
jgi:hypothetical protein